MEVFGKTGLVSVVVGYIEEGVHRYMAVVVDCHKEAHLINCLRMYHGMVVGHGTSEKFIAKRVDQILVAPSIFDCPILDASLHFNLHFLQHNYNHTHSQRDENSW
ncbi:hypothetical protein AHAS_Ahas10G0135800 [Arachis hypogaea]